MLTIAELVRRIVGIERFLIGTERGRHVLEIDADARPGVEAAAHRIDEHVSRFQVRRRFRVTHPPPLDARERVVFLLRARNFDQRMFGDPPAGRSDTRRLACLLPVVGRPRRIAQAFTLVAG